MANETVVTHQLPLPTFETNDDFANPEQLRCKLLDVAMQDPLCALNLYWPDELDMARILMEAHDDTWTILTVAHGTPWTVTSHIVVTRDEFQRLHRRYREEYERVTIYLNQHVPDIET